MTVTKFKHRFTKKGVRVFQSYAEYDIFTELGKEEGGNVPRFYITIGKHEIEIPNTADNYEDLISLLEEALKREEEQC